MLISPIIFSCKRPAAQAQVCVSWPKHYHTKLGQREISQTQCVRLRKVWLMKPLASLYLIESYKTRNASKFVQGLTAPGAKKRSPTLPQVFKSPLMQVLSRLRSFLKDTQKDQSGHNMGYSNDAKQHYSTSAKSMSCLMVKPRKVALFSLSPTIR